MKKLFTSLALAAAFMLTAQPAKALEPQRGYRGFLEWSNGITSYETWYVGHHEAAWFSGLSTSHGYQINRNYFIGLGVAVERCEKFDQYNVPVFANFRLDQTWGKLTPFFDARLGYNCTDGGGVYFSPSIGYRFNWGRKMNINLGLGVAIKGYSQTVYDVYYDDIYDTNPGISYNINSGTKHHGTKALFTFRLGIDF